LTTWVFAQSDVYILHPAIGELIDAQEIKQYMLFPNYTDDSIDHLVITKTDNNFYLNGFTGDKLKFKTLLNEEEIVVQNQHIEKLNAYYQTKTANDSVNSLNKLAYDSIQTQKLNFKILTPEVLKDIKKTTRWDRMEKYRKEARSRQQKGSIL
jgi:hypothetical protein